MPRTKIPGHCCCRGLTRICILCVNEKQWQTHTRESIGEGFEKVASGRIGRTIIGVGGPAVDRKDGIVSGFTSGINQSGVVIKYVDVRTGKEIAPQGNASIRPGEQQTLVPIDIPGYTTPASVTQTIKSHTLITFKYVPETYSVTLCYVDADNNDVVATKTYDATYGAKLIISSFSQDGYRMSRGDTLTVKKSQTVTYKLDRAPGSSSVHSEQSDLAGNQPGQVLSDRTLDSLQDYALDALNSYRAHYDVSQVSASSVALNLAKQESRWALENPSDFAPDPHGNFNNLFQMLPTFKMTDGKLKYYNQGSEETNGDGSTIQHITDVDYGADVDQKDNLTFGNVPGSSSNAWTLADLTSEKQLKLLAADLVKQFGDDGQPAGYDNTTAAQQGASHKIGLMTEQTHNSAGPIEVGFSVYANQDGTLRGYVRSSNANVD